VKTISCAAILVACSAPATQPTAEFPALDKPAAEPFVRSGVYEVAFDLESAELSQEKTGMDSLEWCKSLLAVPAAYLAKIKIANRNSIIEAEWPLGHRASVGSRGDCAFEIVLDSQPPVAAVFTFAPGGATGLASYELGTVNHPEERCRAKNVKLTLRVAP
jgi:hypothetical protein